MASHVDIDDMDHVVRLPPPGKPAFSSSPPRLVIIGAGSRGNVFGKAIQEFSNGVCVGIAEPIALKRQQFGSRYIWGDCTSATPSDGQEFESWEEFLSWEIERRRRHEAGQQVPRGCDGVFICVQDNLHKEVILALVPLGIHIMCEKPLATNLDDCVDIYRSLYSATSHLFSIGHVLRYSPHNMLLRKLLLEDKVIGEPISINHTEPVGWWHFAHSFVRYIDINSPYEHDLQN
jgi:predicted dehydrogenase